MLNCHLVFLHLKMRIFYSCLLSFLFLSGIQETQAQACKKVIRLRQSIEANHIGGALPNDTLQMRWQKLLIKELDPYGLLFIQADVAALTQPEATLFSSAEASCQYYQQLKSVYKQKLIQRQNWLKQLSKQKIKFNSNESFSLLNVVQDIEFATTTEELEKIWLGQAKFELLDAGYTTNPDSVLSQFVASKECRIAKLFPESELGNQRFDEIFLNALAQAYDPHTNYLSGTRLTGFEESLSRTSYSFGFLLIEKMRGQGVVVGSILPGSSAWKSGQIHENDELISWEANGEKNIAQLCMAAFEIQQQINGGPLNQLFTFRKASGELYKVRLQKEEEVVQDNIISSYVLEKEEGKIGYVALPSFYSGWNNSSALGCANDVGKEIMKLQREKIQGLILDLRYNGGGSLQEALSLVSLFIDFGPLLLVSNGKEIELLKDRNRGTVYDGPLVVLVNGYSASASEITASILQEHGRALIMGETTYGKAVGQQMLPFNKNSKVPEVLKVTNISLHKLSGESLQAIGVKPDIYLKSLKLGGMNNNEASQDYAYLPNKLDKNVALSAATSLPIKSLVINSKNRQAIDKDFIATAEVQKQVDRLVGSGLPVRLHPDYFNKDMVTIEKVFTGGELEHDTLALMRVRNHEFDAILYEIDEFKKLNNQFVIDELSIDPYISESYNILLDLHLYLNP